MNIIIIYKIFKIVYKFLNIEGKKYLFWISVVVDRMDKYN